MDGLEMIKMMTSNLRFLDVNPKQVDVKYKAHPRSVQKQCYNNSFRELTDNGKSNSRYVLGYYMFEMEGGGGIPIEHAWVKHGSSYFDVTLEPREMKNDTYISVTELSFEDVHTFVDEHEEAPDLYSLNRFKGNKRTKK